MQRPGCTSVVQEFVRFSTRPWAWCVYLVTCVFSCGLLWLVCHYIPQTRLWMMNQSMLSGETAQVRKSVFVPVGSAGVARFHSNTHPGSTIHAGTVIQQVWNEADAEEEVLAIVVRTGLRSTMGNMLRQVIAPLHQEQLHQDPLLIPDFHGMLPVVSGQFASLQTGATNWSNKLRQAVVVCNALMSLGRGRVVGDPAEKALSTKVEAQFLERNVVTLHMRGSSYNQARMCTVKVLRQFGFDASLLRSAAVAKEAEAASSTAMLFVGGAPSVIGQLVSPDTLPPDYHQGLGRTCMYCGDGINDLAALAAADVGMAIGSSDASAAAFVSDKHTSVSGMLTVIGEARASQTVKVAALKYMVVYQLLVSLAVNSAFFMDGSWFSTHQFRVLDFMALSLGIVASQRPAAKKFQPKRPPQGLCFLKNYVLVLEAVLVSSASMAAILILLTHQPWFQGGNGQNIQNPVVAAVWLTTVGHMISPMASFSADTHP